MSAHLRRRILQAAQGLAITGGGGEGGDARGEVEDDGDKGEGVFPVVSLTSIVVTDIQNPKYMVKAKD